MKGIVEMMGGKGQDTLKEEAAHSTLRPRWTDQLLGNRNQPYRCFTHLFLC
jgi:hypothetical protein